MTLFHVKDPPKAEDSVHSDAEFIFHVYLSVASEEVTSPAQLIPDSNQSPRAPYYASELGNGQSLYKHLPRKHA